MSQLRRFVLVTSGVVSVGLGIIGIFVPGMPTTVFLILASWCFVRSSPRLASWLQSHPRFGPPLRAWQQHGAVPRKAKVAAVSTMTLSAFVLFTVLPGWPAALVGLLLGCVGGWLVTRPEPHDGAGDARPVQSHQASGPSGKNRQIIGSSQRTWHSPSARNALHSLAIGPPSDIAPDAARITRRRPRAHRAGVQGRNTRTATSQRT